MTTRQEPTTPGARVGGIELDDEHPFPGSTHRCSDSRPESRPRATQLGGVLDRHIDACNCCCLVLIFYSTRANAARWCAEQPHARGQAISMDDAHRRKRRPR